MSIHDDAIIIARAAADMIKHAESAANNQNADTLCCWESERIAGHERVIQVRNHPEGDDETIIAVPTESGVAAHIAGWHPNTGLAVGHWLDDLSCAALRKEPVDKKTFNHALTIARAYLADHRRES